MSRVVCDNSRCVGCLACVVTCMDHHYAGEEADAVPMRLYSKKKLPSGLMQYFTVSCYHCNNAPCVKACPVGAITKREDGLVMVDQEVCVGCRRCGSACPFHIPRYNARGKMVKCDRCGGETPACVKVCPRGALTVK